MAGNSKRRGAVRRDGTKKGQHVGSGGQRRRALEGKGPTPKASQRPGHPAARRAKAADRSRGAGAPTDAARPGGAGVGGKQGRTGGTTGIARGGKPGSARQAAANPGSGRSERKASTGKEKFATAHSGGTSSGRPVGSGGAVGRSGGAAGRSGGRSGFRSGSGTAGRRPTARNPRAAAGRRRDEAQWIAGRNPVLEALQAEVPVNGVYVSPRLDADPRIRQALQLASDRGIALLEASKTDLDRMTVDAVHQGIAARLPAYEYAHPMDLLQQAHDRSHVPLIVALDGVTDPRNLGAIIRSVAAFGGHGVVVAARRSAPMGAAAWKTSAGAAARIPVAQATNLTRALVEYQKSGCTVIGLAADGERQLRDIDAASGPVVLVVGAEDAGLSRLVRETCDVVATIPMAGQMESLNASVAMGIALYEVAQQRTA